MSEAVPFPLEVLLFVRSSEYFPQHGLRELLVAGPLVQQADRNERGALHGHGQLQVRVLRKHAGQVHREGLHDVLLARPDLRSSQSEHDADRPRLEVGLEVEVNVRGQEAVQQALQAERVDEAGLVVALRVGFLVVDPGPQGVFVFLFEDFSGDFEPDTDTAVELGPVDVVVFLLERESR